MKEKAKILIIDDEESIRFGFGSFLRSKGYGILEAGTGAKGMAVVQSQTPDLVLLDMKLPDIDGIDLLKAFKSENEFMVVLMVTAFGTIEKAVKALKLGAENFLTKPFDPESLLIIIEHSLKNHHLRKQEAINEFAKKSESEDHFVGKSVKMAKVQEMASIIAADQSVTVLIQGETGSGKGILAQWIHQNSDRSEKAFVEVNCAGLSKELLESELFGYEKGAFTGAANSKTGLVEIAHGGTLFLDEIAEMEMAVQAKVLTVVEQKKFRRLGSVQERRSDVRVIVATNKNLEKRVKDGQFREDLFYRLNVMPLELPSLRERKEDIIPLAEFFLKKMARQKSVPVPALTAEACNLLSDYQWPGNFRELKNVLERAFILTKVNEIGADLLPIQKKVTFESTDASLPMIPLREVEIKYIKHVLASVDNNYRKAADILGVNRNTLYNRLKEEKEES